MRGTKGGELPGGIETTEDTHSQGPRQRNKKHVTFRLENNTTSPEVEPVCGFNPSATPSQSSMAKSDEGDVRPQLVTTPEELGSVWEKNWGDAYLSCPTWKEKWGKTQSTTEWPHDFKFFNNQMFFEEKLCIPTCFQNDVVQENHEFLGHV